MRPIDADTLLKNRFNMYMGFMGTVPVVTVEDIDNAPTIYPESLRPKGKWTEGDWTGEINCPYLNSSVGDKRHLCEHTPLNCRYCHMNNAKHNRNKKCPFCGNQKKFETNYCSTCGAELKEVDE